MLGQIEDLYVEAKAINRLTTKQRLSAVRREAFQSALAILDIRKRNGTHQQIEDPPHEVADSRLIDPLGTGPLAGGNDDRAVFQLLCKASNVLDRHWQVRVQEGAGRAPSRQHPASDGVALPAVVREDQPNRRILAA